MNLFSLARSAVLAGKRASCGRPFSICCARLLPVSVHNCRKTRLYFQIVCSNHLRKPSDTNHIGIVLFSTDSNENTVADTAAFNLPVAAAIRGAVGASQ